jgi:hypothetical protein
LTLTAKLLKGVSLFVQDQKAGLQKEAERQDAVGIVNIKHIF